jgi:general secretion pathway protein L
MVVFPRPSSSFVFPGSFKEAWGRWTREMAAFLPATVRRELDRDPYEHTFQLRGKDLWVNSNSTRTWVPLSSNSNDRIGIISRGMGSATLEVPIGRCHIKEVKLTQTALGKADDLLGFDLELATPFKRADVLSGWYQVGTNDTNRKTTIHHIILKRSTVADALVQIQKAGLPLSGVFAVDEAGRRYPFNLLPAQEVRNARIVRLFKKLIRPAALFAAIVLGTALVLHVTSQFQTLETLDTALAKAKVEADDAKSRKAVSDTLFSQLREVRDRKNANVALTAIWEELTKVLPPTTWLSDIRLDDNTIIIDGQSANASELISALSSSSVLSGAAFASPVTRDAQRGTERFQIRLRASNQP